MTINNEVIDFLQTRRKSKDICQKFNCTDRAWRRAVNEFNSDYFDKEMMIISNRFGYILTTNRDVVKKYAFERISHAVSELKNAKKMLKALSEKGQLTFMDSEMQNLRDIVMRINDGGSR